MAFVILLENYKKCHSFYTTQNTQTTCTISPKEKTGTIRPCAISVPKAKLGHMDHIEHWSKRQSLAIRNACHIICKNWGAAIFYLDYIGYSTFPPPKFFVRLVCITISNFSNTFEIIPMSKRLYTSVRS